MTTTTTSFVILHKWNGTGKIRRLPANKFIFFSSVSMSRTTDLPPIFKVYTRSSNTVN